MTKNISDICKGCYIKHQIENRVIYTDQYGKAVIEEASFATVVYNHHTNKADIFCNHCGNWIGSAYCSTNSFWNYVHDFANAHTCKK